MVGGRFCHPECNEGSYRQNDKILRFAQNDKKKRQNDKKKRQDDKKKRQDDKKIRQDDK